MMKYQKFGGWYQTFRGLTGNHRKDFTNDLTYCYTKYLVTTECTNFVSYFCSTSRKTCVIDTLVDLQ